MNESLVKLKPEKPLQSLNSSKRVFPKHVQVGIINAIDDKLKAVRVVALEK